MSTLAALRATSESITAEQRRLTERKRNILVLINAYLIENGYFETLEKFSSETNGVGTKYEVADNIDLNLILADYENYYEIRFERKPKIVRKLNEGEESKSKRSTSDSKRTSAIGKKSSDGVVKSSGETSCDDQNTELGVQGTRFTGKRDTENGAAQPEERVLKPPPQFHHDPEMKQLVAIVSREIYQHSPNVKFDDIIGLDNAKRLLKEAIQLPISFPSIFTGILRPWRGILLHGPPGVVPYPPPISILPQSINREKLFSQRQSQLNVIRHFSVSPHPHS